MEDTVAQGTRSVTALESETMEVLDRILSVSVALTRDQFWDLSHSDHNSSPEVNLWLAALDLTFKDLRWMNHYDASKRQIAQEARDFIVNDLFSIDFMAAALEIRFGLKHLDMKCFRKCMLNLANKIIASPDF